jgi:CBS domain-containing protein
MEREITTIPLIQLGPALPCDTPDPRTLFTREDDPAISVMTDFSRVPPITVEPIMTIDYALHKMMKRGVRLLLITGEHDHVIGIITSYDIQGEKAIKYSQETGVSHSNITVEMFMTSLRKMPAFDLDFVKQSLVRHVIATLEDLNRQHALVVTRSDDNQSQRIRGMFSTSHISRCLGKEVGASVHAAPSLAEIQKKLTEH